jgi:hypothetical protein
LILLQVCFNLSYAKQVVYTTTQLPYYKEILEKGENNLIAEVTIITDGLIFH